MLLFLDMTWTSLVAHMVKNLPAMRETRVQSLGREDHLEIQLLATPWTVAYQAPLFIGFSRQEYWNGLLCLPARDLPAQGSHHYSLHFLHCRWILYLCAIRGVPILETMKGKLQ